MSPDRTTRLLGVLGWLALGWATLVLLTGGIGTSVAGLRISSHDAARPFLIALVLLGIAVRRQPPAERFKVLDRLAAVVDRWAARAAALAALAVFVVAVVFGVHVACGADSFGYVSQSALWRAGLLRWPVETLSDAPWPDSGWQVAPLGYGPARTAGTLAYSYSPGVPWLMALLRIPFGDAGPYLVTPLLGALLVWLTFVYVRQRSAPGPALAAALLVGSSPPFLFQMMWSMSDVPVAALWVAVLVRVPPRSVAHALGTGTLMALALVVRPNLALVAVAVWLATSATELAVDRSRGTMARLVALAAPLSLAVMAIGALNTIWRGSPLLSGYGGVSDIFAPEMVPGNIRRQFLWLLETDSWVVILGLAALPLLMLRGPAAHRWRIGAALVLAVWVSYIGWGNFTEWWYLRFQLPGWAVTTGAGCVALWSVIAWRSRPVATVVVVALAVAGALHGARLTHTNRVFRLWWGEQRYVAAAQWLQARTPADAVVIALQHSGTVGYYGQRAMLRYDYIAPEALEGLVTSLEAKGRRVYFLGEDWEEIEFRGRFAGATALGRLDWAPLASIDAGLKVRVYALGAGPGRQPAGSPEIVPFDHQYPWTRLNAPPGSWLAPPHTLAARLAAPRAAP